LIAFAGTVGWCSSRDWIAASSNRCARAGSDRNCLSASVAGHLGLPFGGRGATAEPTSLPFGGRGG
jgi:hypothetical protein